MTDLLRRDKRKTEQIGSAGIVWGEVVNKWIIESWFHLKLKVDVYEHQPPSSIWTLKTFPMLLRNFWVLMVVNRSPDQSSPYFIPFQQKKTNRIIVLDLFSTCWWSLIQMWWLEMIVIWETKGQRGIKTIMNMHEKIRKTEKKRLMNEMMMVLNPHQVIKGCAMDWMKRRKEEIRENWL